MSEKATIPPFVNKTMKFILRSPLHGLVSKTVLLISFTGVKSGKTYTTPVSYSQTDNQVNIFTHGEWWKNLVNGSSVILRIRGQDFVGQAEPVIGDKQIIKAALSEHLKQVRSDATFYEVTFDEQGNPRPKDVAKAVETVVMIHVRLNPSTLRTYSS